jgi:hypothetical protein
MKAFLVANDARKLYKKSELSAIKIEYAGGCQKWHMIQIWLLWFKVVFQKLGLFQFCE